MHRDLTPSIYEAYHLLQQDDYMSRETMSCPSKVTLLLIQCHRIRWLNILYTRHDSRLFLVSEKTAFEDH